MRKFHLAQKQILVNIIILSFVIHIINKITGDNPHLQLGKIDDKGSELQEASYF